MPEKILRLRVIDPESVADLGYLYGVLMLRLHEPNTNISHLKMPTWDAHVKFVRSRPYAAHYLILENEWPAGVCYIDHARNVGLYIDSLFRRQGLGSRALAQLIKRHPGPLWANINPNNTVSLAFFAKHGFTAEPSQPFPQQVSFKRGEEKHVASTNPQRGVEERN